MAGAEYELGYIHAALTVLEKYLLVDEVYWSLAANPPAGEPSYPNLTLGTLLLMQQKLSARGLSARQQADLARIGSQIAHIQTRWRSAWEKKAGREFGARLTLWRNFLEDYRREPENHSDRYAYEVSRRVMLTLLGATSEPAQAELEMLDGLDRLLRSVFIPGEFLWEADFERGFPAATFWYLYGRMRRDSD